MKTHVNTNRMVAMGTLGVLTLTSTAMLAPPVQAGPSTWKKIAIGSAAVTGYGLIKKKKKVALIGGVATAGSYLMYRRSKKKQEAQKRLWYQRRYGRNWRAHYYTKR